MTLFLHDKRLKTSRRVWKMKKIKRSLIFVFHSRTNTQWETHFNSLTCSNQIFPFFVQLIYAEDFWDLRNNRFDHTEEHKNWIVKISHKNSEHGLVRHIV